MPTSPKRRALEERQLHKILVAWLARFLSGRSSWLEFPIKKSRKRHGNILFCNEANRNMNAAEAEYLTSLALQRDELCQSMFCEASLGKRGLVEAITEVLKLKGDEPEDLSTFLQVSQYGFRALESVHDFVACVNAFAAKRQKAVSNVMTRAAIKCVSRRMRTPLRMLCHPAHPERAATAPGSLIAEPPPPCLPTCACTRWHVHLQRTRRKIHVVSSSAAPDDIMQFPAAMAAGSASESRFKRQSVSVDTTTKPTRPEQIRKSMGGGAMSFDETSTPRGRNMPTPQSLRRQQTKTFADRLSSADLDEDADADEAPSESEVGATPRPDDSWENASSYAATPRSGATATPIPPRGPTSNSPKQTAEGQGSAPLVLETSAAPLAPPGPRAGAMMKSAEMGEEGGEPLPLPPAICGTFSCHGMDEGKDKTNQDCACLAYPMRNDNDAALFAVLDGHGDAGDVVSNELLQQLHDQISKHTWDGDEATCRSHCVNAFEHAHESVRTFEVDSATGVAPAMQSGAVGVAMVLRRGVVTMAWAGDSRAVMGTLDDRGEVECIELSSDHKLEDAEERLRIEATGAYIRPTQEEPYYNPARVYADRSNPKRGPGLTMSRSLGDIDADACGVIPTPEVRFHRLRPGRDRFIVLASDGVWEFLSSENVCEIVNGFWERGEDAIQATRFVIAKAAMAWRVEEGDYRDDITCIILYLHDLPKNLAPPA